jgi:hypothetical protein
MGKPRGRPFVKGDPNNPGFKKGQSGNPEGFSAWQKEIARLASSHVPMAIARLAEIAQSGDGQPAVRACEVILERSGGKAIQPVSGPDGQHLMPFIVIPAPDPNA